MVSGLHVRPILAGAVTLAAGYGACALAAMGASNSGSTVLAALAAILFLLAPAAGGFGSAFFATSRRITHGLCGGVLGAVVVLAGLAVLRVPIAPAHSAVLAGTFVLGAWLGALLAVLAASRRGR